MRPPLVEPGQEIWGQLHVAVCVVCVFIAVFL